MDFLNGVEKGILFHPVIERALVICGYYLQNIKNIKCLTTCPSVLDGRVLRLLSTKLFIKCL